MERYKTLFTILAIFITVINAIGMGVTIGGLGNLFSHGDVLTAFMPILG